MDINLTGQIASTLAENLRQPWYNPLVNTIAGIVGGFVTGIITLIAIKINNDNTKKRDEQNRKRDVYRIQREERKNAYKNFNALE
ncbi:MAG: hypothetical protein NTX42_06390 [Methanothrix sp.]|nr:hypothetical protein [Methanothrix sp.]